MSDEVRRQQRALTDRERAEVAAIKARGEALLIEIGEHGNSRELSLARTKVEEAVMWAVKHVTG